MSTPWPSTPTTPEQTDGGGLIRSSQYTLALNPLNTVFSIVPSPNGLGRPSFTSGKNGEGPMTSPFPDHSSCWVKLFSREKMTPPIQGYHVGGFSYIRQPLDILGSFIFYFLWTERCRKHFGNLYSSRKILQQAWVATVQIEMATWKAINSLRSTRDPSIQAGIDQAFKVEWCHLGIFGADCATIVWCFLPPLHFSDFFNV